ncbi:hypothetical protein DMA12_43300, partial [Amycolatopsis balhimycina DSM 5908]
GVAGIIKMVMAMRHGVLPRTLHVDERSSHVDWESGAVSLLTETRDWPGLDRPRRAAVSSFGISGTNAHTILEQPAEPAPVVEASTEDVLVPWVLSAKSPDALTAQAAALPERAVGEAAVDVAWSLARTRSAFEHRAVVLAADTETALTSLRNGEVLSGTRVRGKLAVLFSGQGAQRAGMGRELYVRYPVFAEALDEVLAELEIENLREVMWFGDGLDRTEYTQPALFAVEVALFRLVESWGVKPDFVAGHSVGEITAAYVAGVLSLADACSLVAARGRLMQALPAGGAMLAVRATEEQARQWTEVSIAAVNSPNAVVLSGSEEAIDGIRADRAKRLPVSHAFHSSLMEPMLAEFARALDGITFHEPTLPVVSNVTGGFRDQGSIEYWVRHVRDTVRFADGLNTLHGEGVRTFLELGPDATLTTHVAELAGVTGIPALRKDKPEGECVVRALSLLYIQGAAIDWDAFFAPLKPRRVDLPTYPFQHQVFWPKPRANAGDATGFGLAATGHPLLSAAVAMADASGVVLTGSLSLRTHPWLAEHVVNGQVLFPGTGFVELAIRAGDEAGCARLADLTLLAPLALPAREPVQIQVRVAAEQADGTRGLMIYSRSGSGHDWIQHATGTLRPGAAATGSTGLETWPPAATPVDIETFYAELEALGLAYGPRFRGVESVWKGAGNEWFAEVALDAETDGFGVHPALLDAALHGIRYLRSGEPGGAVVPFAWHDVELHATGATRLRVRLTRSGEDTIALAATDHDGVPVVTVGSLTLRSAGTAPVAVRREGLFDVDWTPATATSRTGLSRIAVVGAEDLAGLLLGAGLPVQTASDLAALAATDVPRVVLAEVAPPAGDVPSGVHTLTAEVLDLVQRWLAEEAFAGSRLVLLTRHAGVRTAPARGLVRSALAENPGRFALLDLAGTPDAALLIEALTCGEPEVRVTGDAVLAPRLHRATAAGSGTCSGTVLITGGTGGVGRVLTKHLLDSGAERVVLASRRGTAAWLSEVDGPVEVRTCDVSDAGSVSALVDAVAAEYGLDLVIHAAGVLADGVVGSLTPESLDTVLAPKVDAAWHLHRALEQHPDVRLVLFSSVAGVLGTAGQGNYAAANSFLDALAEVRTAEGRPTLSVAWGPWALADGLVGELSEADRDRMARAGVPPLPADRALALLDAALTVDGRIVATGLDVAALRERAVLPGVLRDVAGSVRRRVSRADAPAAADLTRRLAALTPAEQAEAVAEVIGGRIAAVLGHATGTVFDADKTFQELGFDSLTAVELRNGLDAATDLRLPTTLVFDYPTIGALTGYLLERLGSGAGQSGQVTAVTRPVSDDPIVIVGMGCRYPGGVSSPEDLWRLVADGVDAITEFPSGRGWDLDSLYDPDPEHAGTSYTRRGGFLHEAGEFDAEFFGMSPREAMATDAQQRQLLETSWEALERAGINPVSLRGSDTGVFAGVMYSDYGKLLQGSEFEAYQGMGSAPSVLSGRVSYTLGLEGPAVSVDTACSSSLVALHWAVQALRAGECSLALAGGVTVMATPNTFIQFSRQRGLSEDGRCKSYGDGADGVGWSEGAGMLVLERLSDARRNGHEVLAIIRGSAVNQDGASNGLTAPNGPSQQRVIRQALASAGLSTWDIDVVEGHGTGTTLGDPIEAQALLATYGQDRETPLWLGSLKSNIGHTQAAAGVAGIIKMVMAMRHGVLPRSLHSGDPSSHVDWESGAVSLLSESRGWPEAHRPRRAAVSSFGISGTNAHTVIEAPEPAPAAPVVVRDDVLVPWVLSARTPEALRDQARTLAEGIGDQDSVDIGGSLATSRAAFEHRAVVLAEAHAVDSLRSWAAEGVHANVISGARVRGKLAVLFSGQGAQRAGMGRELYVRYPVFAEALDEVLAELGIENLREVMWSGDGLDRTEYTQPALFAVEVALFRLVESWGVKPDFVAGHSVGEITAAYVAGVLSLADACSLVVARGRLMQALPAGGAMLAVRATEEEARLWTEVSIAAVNGPNAVVLSGSEEAIDGIRADRAKRLPVSHAFHSSLMEPMLAEFARALDGITFHEPAIPVVSNVTGGFSDQGTIEYWVRHVRDTVRFADGVNTLHGEGVRTFLELGPDATLTTHVAELDEVTGIPALRKDKPENETLLRALAGLYVQGVGVDWDAFFAPLGPRRATLPTYPFQHQTYWPIPKAAAAQADPVDAEFWAAVEREDSRTLAGELGLDGASLDTVLPALASWRTRSREQSVVDPWRYRITWAPLPEPDEVRPGTWLLVEPGDRTHQEWADHVENALTGQGLIVLRSTVDRMPVDEPIAGVLSLLGIAEHACAGFGSVPSGLAGTAELLKALAGRGITAPVWCATSGAVGVEDGEPVPHPLQATIWGLGRGAALEYPRQWGGLVDLPAELDERAARRLAATLSGAGGEDQVAIRESGSYARRMVRARRTPGSARRQWRPRGTVLITGGTGGLGATIARWAAKNGAEHLVLASRRGPAAPGAADLREELAAHGAQVTVAACDVADKEQLAALLAEIGGPHPLRAVFHATGVADHQPIAELGTDSLDTTLRAKVTSARHLAELTRDAELDAFVLFSSIAAVWGSHSQPGYCAANTYLDALAQSRRADGLPATSVSWGAWAEAGMLAGSADLDVLRSMGVTPMRPAYAVAALQQALDDDETLLTVADVDWATFAPRFTVQRPSPLLGDLPEVRTALATAGAAEPAADRVAELRGRLAGAPAAERERELVKLVRAAAARVLGHAGPAAIPPDRPFSELGFDSLTAVELRKGLVGATGLALPASLVFDRPSPAVLARFLLAELFPAGGPAGDGGAETARYQELLAAIPPARLRRSGLLDMLTRLAEDGEGTDENGDARPDGGSSLDEMDGESLLRLVRDSAQIN